MHSAVVRHGAAHVTGGAGVHERPAAWLAQACACALPRTTLAPLLTRSGALSRSADAPSSAVRRADPRDASPACDALHTHTVLPPRSALADASEAAVRLAWAVARTDALRAAPFDEMVHRDPAALRTRFALPGTPATFRDAATHIVAALSIECFREGLHARGVQWTTALIRDTAVCRTARASFLTRVFHVLAASQHTGAAMAGAQPASTPMHPATALAALFDACVDADVRIPDKALSRLVGAMARTLPPDTLVDVLDAVAARFLHQGSDDWAAGVLTALIPAYGKTGHPGRGESVLRAMADASGPSRAVHTCGALARAHRSDPRVRQHLRQLHELRENAARPTPDDVPLTHAWQASTAVWSALARARAAAGDMGGARIWFERFRLLAVVLPAPPNGAPRPARTCSPYLVLMHAATSADGVHAWYAQDSARGRRATAAAARARKAPHKTAIVHGLLRRMHADGVVPGVAMLNFLARFEAGRDRVGAASALVAEALAVPRVRENGGASPFQLHASTLIPAFSVHAAAARAAAVPWPTRAAPAPFAAHATPPSLRASLAQIRTPRGTLATCVAMHRARALAPRWWADNACALLNEALDAFMHAHDMPAALLVLHLFARWRVAPDRWTKHIVWRALSQLVARTLLPMPALDDLSHADKSAAFPVPAALARTAAIVAKELDLEMEAVAREDEENVKRFK
ncbi:lipoyl(octanoyl) transferase [Malassezia sp. CBS 17886]|nr:lipoyl(octanoyl) transferase [Malassezia sp. CBS 17886]